MADDQQENQEELIEKLEYYKTLQKELYKRISELEREISRKDQLIIDRIWFDNKFYEFDTSEDQCDAKYSTEDEGLKALSRAAILCNRAVFKPGQDNLPAMKRQCYGGDNYETAFLKFRELVYQDVHSYRKQHRKIVEIPFNSANSFQVSIHLPPADDADRRLILIMIATPKRILESSTTMLVNGQEIALGDTEKQLFKEAFLELADSGQRVFGFCDYRLPLENYPNDFVFDSENVNFPLTGLRFVGLMSIRNY